MKPSLLHPLAFACLLLPACESYRHHDKYHTAAIKPPSVAEVKGSIAEAGAASRQTSARISEIKAGTDRVDRKAVRALEYFLTE